ncbi:MAG: transcriptional regulator [Spirochaetes bacterium]|nr:transcriptional regulator [Spirochaetota bacterium]
MNTELDPVIHERSRLLILSYIASNEKKNIAFNELKAALSLTAGNLSIQLKTLEKNGYVTITKKFSGNKPLTEVSMTAQGIQALKEHLTAIESLLKSLR